MRKQIGTFLTASLTALSLSAQNEGVTTLTDGFYRVLNNETERYITLVDDKASLNAATTDVDLKALHGRRGFAAVESNPASVIYIQKTGGGYVLQAQGADTYKMTGEYLQLQYLARKNGWRAYASKSGLVKYVTDFEYDNEEESMMGTAGQDGKYINWTILPVNAHEGQHFGIKPEFEADGAFYTSFYASFGFSFASPGMKAYTVVGAIRDMVVVREVTNSSIAPATPVLIRCSASEAVNNRLNLLTQGDDVGANMLKGVYFNSGNYKHENRVRNDRATMRVLGLLPDGSLGFVQSDEEYLPANKAYLKLAADTPAMLKIVSEQEYAADIQTADAKNPDALHRVTTLIGETSLCSSDQLSQLPAGIYVVDGEKVFVR